MAATARAVPSGPRVARLRGVGDYVAPAPDPSTPDLLHVTYNQVSPSISFINVVALNLTTFVAIDTILDLTWVAMANFFAVLDLVAAPPLLAHDALWPHSVVPKEEEEEEAVLAALAAGAGPLPPPPAPATSIAAPALAAASAPGGADDAPIPARPSTTMNLVVKVTNPQIILLDDPTTDESRAIVSSGGIVVHYSREFRHLGGTHAASGLPNRELRESLHVSVKDHKVFVLRSMLHWSPQPILEPMGMEYNLRRRSVNGVAVASNLSMDVYNVHARVSINDVFLAQSIMTRKALTEPPPPAAAAAAAGAGVKAAEDEELYPEGATEAEAEAAGPVYTFSLNLGTMSWVGINDFNGQNVPVVRALLDGTTFYAEGNPHKLKGDGSLIASADSYNPVMAVWEPILDRWHPSLSLGTWPTGSMWEVRSEHTMQLTVSGVMLEKLLQTYSLLHRQDDGGAREEVPDVVINNALGPDIPVDVYDAATTVKLLTVAGNESKAVPKVAADAGAGAAPHTRRGDIHSVVDVHFGGRFGEERLPLHHLPFNISKPRTYNLIPRPLPGEEEVAAAATAAAVAADASSATGSARGRAGSFRAGAVATSKSRSVLLEPIVEEVYEYSRYDPITGKWRKPFLPGDPLEWTDASGTLRRDIQAITLKQSGQWEWLDKWSIDLDGVAGDEVDKEGWEYGTVFSNFSIASRRRAHHSMDCVRRRRWTRTRVPAAASIDERFRPLSVFWDVRALQNGTRRVDIRSGLQVTNLMPFAVHVSLSYSGWATDSEFGPIDEGAVFNVPLLQSCATWMKFRPAALPYEWSNHVGCNLQTYDFTTTRDIMCNGASGGGANADTDAGGAAGGGAVEGSAERLTPACMRVLCCQTNKSLMITVAPFLSITNRLPCDLKYVCFYGSGETREEGALQSGETCKLANMDLSRQPKVRLLLSGPPALFLSPPIHPPAPQVCLRVGEMRWSAARPIGASMEPTPVDIFTHAGDIGAVLTMFVRTNADTGTLEAHVYSKALLRDRTGGLGVSVWSVRHKGANAGRGGGDLVRSTFRTATGTGAAPIARPSVSLADKKRRRAAIRAGSSRARGLSRVGLHEP